jgi:hypothetical protein
MRTKSLKEAFWDRVVKTEYCWDWIGPKMPFGYGHFYINATRKYAHRFSFEIHNSITIPKGLQINHNCDNPSCVNPEHLYIGTQKDNIRDKIVRERASRLTRIQVLEIRSRYSKGNTTWTKLAKEYGVSKTHIGYIINRKSWFHI